MFFTPVALAENIFVSVFSYISFVYRFLGFPFNFLRSVFRVHSSRPWICGLFFSFILPIQNVLPQTIPGSALPRGGAVQHGSATIEVEGANMVVRQDSTHSVIDWRSFDLGSTASIHFSQPGSSSATLNRVAGESPSSILGRITAPGQIFISNGNGLFFGRTASIDVGSLVATTMDLSIEDFMAGQLRFLQGANHSSQVINEGELRVRLEGFIALLAPEVRNDGLVFAKKGTVAFASGSFIELQLDPNQKLTGIRVEASEWEALVQNSHVIEAEEGLVILSAQALGSLHGGLIRNTGNVKATGIKQVGGRIFFTSGENGSIEQGGRLNASSTQGKGGLITLEADKINLQSNSAINATGSEGGGEVLVGGDWQGGSNDEMRVLLAPNALNQATKVWMDENSKIDASATRKGDGGTVVLWSDIENPNSLTTVAGKIYSNGGAYEGDGGMVETSGHRLEINSAGVSTLAHLGTTGTWLLDPANINITSSGSTASDSLPGFPVGSDTLIHPTSVVNALASSNVSIQTGTGDYDLSVSSPISSSAANDLTLEAGRNIIISASVDTGSGGLALDAANDLTIGADLTTANSSDSAIILTAGKNDSAGISTGGEVIISGTPTITTGGSGRVTIFTGSVSGSTGLTSLVGTASGNFRYNSDESSTNFTESLSSGTYAIYREQPTSTISSSSSSITYGDATPTISASDLQNGDTLTWSVDSATYTDHGSGTSYLNVTGANDENGDFQEQSYTISENLTALGYLVTNSDTITVTQKEVSLSATKTYDGTNVLEGSEVSIANLVANESLNYSDATVLNTHVMADSNFRYINEITLTNGTIQSPAENSGDSTYSQNYKLPTLNSSSSPVTINVATLSVSVNDGSSASPSTGLTKTYDGFDSAADDFSPTYDFSGLVTGDTGTELSFSDANYNSANVAEADTLTVSGITINNIVGSNDSYPTDYALETTTETVAGSIAPANLTVTANASFKFYNASGTIPDPTGYAGVSYSGFANNEDSSILSGSVSLSRSAGSAVGAYALTPDVSGLSSDNYSFTAVNGVFSIIPVNELMVDLSDASTTYGAASPIYTITSVSYYDGSETQTVSSSLYSIDASNQTTVSDGSDNIIFTIGPPSGNNSSSGNLKVGIYKLEASGVTDNSAVFSSDVSINGTHTVSPLSITLSQSQVSSGKTKIYDGTPDMEGLAYDLSSLIESGDSVDISGLGTYRDASGNADKDVAYSGTTDEGHTITYNVIDKNYRIENVILSGTEKSNYVLFSNTIDGTDGRINQRPIHYLPAQKTYDGNNYISNYIVPEEGSPYYSSPIIKTEIIVLDPTDDSGDSATKGIINNENFSYISSDYSNANIGIIDSKHVTGPDDHKETYGFEHDSVDAGSRSDNFIAKIILSNDSSGSAFEPQNYSLPTLNSTNAPFKVIPKDLKITGTKVYDSSDDWPDSGLEALTITTDITGESLQYSSASTADEHAGVLSAGVRSMTYISGINLQDAADAARQTSGSYNASGFITDYEFSGKELWDVSDSDHTDITISSINDTADLNDVTITPKVLSITGISIDDKVYDGTSTSVVQLGGVDWDSLGRVSGDDLDFDTVTGAFPDKDVSLSGTTVQDKTVTLTSSYTGSDSANYDITDQAEDQAKINQRPLSFLATKTYDGTTTITQSEDSAALGSISGDSDSGLVGSETLNFSVTSNSKDVSDANKFISMITLSDGSNDGMADNYIVPSSNLGSYDSGLNAVVINKKTVSLTASKVYDGQTQLTGSDVTITTGIGSETLSYSGATSSDKDVASSSKFIDAITLADATDGSGGLIANYQLPALNSANAPVTITVKALTMSGLTSTDKEYDGTTTAVVSGSPGSLQGAITAGSGSNSDGKPYSGDTVSLTGTAVGAFNDKDVADATTVAFSGVSLIGSEAENYSLTAHPDASHSITPKPMTISGLTAYDNTYNGGTSVYIWNTNIVMSGLITIGGVADDVSRDSGWNGTMTDAHVGSGKSVTITSSYSGVDVGNYSITDQTSTTVDISPREVKLSASRVYDGTTSLGSGVVSITTGLSHEALGYNSATSNSMDVSGDNYINSITLVDATGLASNYTTPDLSSYNALKNSVTITAKPLTITGLSSADKIFDASTTASVLGTAVLQSEITAGSGTDTDGIPYSGDSIALSGTPSGSFDSANAGSRTVSFGGLSLTGTGSKASNYTLADHATANHEISEKSISLSATKEYDGDNTLTGSEVTIETNTGEVLNYSGATVSDSNVATGSKYISAITIEDNGAVLASNYNMPTLNVTNTPASITAKTVSLEASRVYNGTTDLTGSVTVTTGVGSETLTYTGASANDKNVVTANKYITSITLGDSTDGSGGVATNYQLPTFSHPNAPVTITSKALTISGLSSADKVYDATISAVLSGSASLQTSITGGTGTDSDGKPYTGDTISLSGTAVANFDDKDVADATTVSFSGLSLSGAEAGNYSLTTHADSSHSITPKALTISGLSSADKVYDATVSAVVVGTASLQTSITGGTGIGSDGKPYTGDTVSLSGTAVANFNDKDVADANTVSFLGLSLSGAEAGNYSLNSHPNGSYSILSKSLNLSGNKTYDSSSSFDRYVTLKTGIENETLNYSGAISKSKDVMTANNFLVAIFLQDAVDGSGGLASNYQLPNLDADDAPVTITAKTVGLSATRIYDGSVGLTGAVDITTGVGSESLAYSSATSSSRDVATSGKYIDAITLLDAVDGSGGLASNYQLPNLDANDAPVIITEKTVGLSASRIYDGSVDLTGAVDIITGVGSESLAYSAATSSSRDVATSGKYIDAITLLDAVDGSGGLASNYQLPNLDAIHAPVTITETIVGLSASRIYDGSVDLTGAVDITTGVGSESLAYSAATSSSKDVATSGKYIDAINLLDAVDGSGGLATNYQLPSLDAIHAPVTIRPKTVSLSANRNKQAVGEPGPNEFEGMIYEVSDQTFTLEEAQAYASEQGAEIPFLDIGDPIIEFLKELVFQNLGEQGIAWVGGIENLLGNQPIITKSRGLKHAPAYKKFSVLLVRENTVVAERDPNSLKGMIYDGTIDLMGSVDVTTGVDTESLTYSGATSSSKDVATSGKYIDAITLLDAVDGSGGLASNYQLPTLDATHAPVTIRPKIVSLFASRMYDGSVDLTGAVNIETGVDGEALSYTNASLNSKNVSEATFIESIILTNGSKGSATNYTLPVLDALSAPAKLDPVSLLIQAHDETKTYGQLPELPVDAFTAFGLIQGEAVDEVLLFSDGSSTEAPPGEYDIIPFLASGESFLSSNYEIGYLQGTMFVEASPFEKSTAVASVSEVKTVALMVENSGVSNFANSNLNTMIAGAQDAGFTVPAPSIVLPLSTQGTPVTLPITQLNEPTMLQNGTNPPASSSSGIPSTSSANLSRVTNSAIDQSTEANTESISTSRPLPSAGSSESVVVQKGSQNAGTKTETSSIAVDGPATTNVSESSGLLVDLIEQPSTSAAGLVAVSIPAESGVSGTGFSFGLPSEVSQLMTETPSSVGVTLQSGDPLPAWLSFDQKSAQFTSTAVPDGAFPVTVLMSVGGQEVTVVISERTE